jgi:DNA processing protein
MDDRTREWIRISLIEGIGEKRLLGLMQTFKDPFRILKKETSELSAMFPALKQYFEPIKQSRKDITEYLKKLQDYDVQVLTILDQGYPNTLREIPHPPPILYVRGTFQTDDDIAIGMVGSRKASYYGKRVAEKFSRELVSRGFSIVSGMARGIDTIAHQAAIHEGGRTIAFLGSGIDVVYPRENRRLMQNIIRHGAVVSEFPLGTEPVAINFPQRNRLISGMSLGILIVEATLKSGTFTTVKWALEQGKEVFAMPGDILRKTSSGANKLIQRGAKLVVEIDDIVEEFPFLRQQEAVSPTPVPEAELSSTEKMVFDSLNASPKLIDDIIDTIRLPSSKTASILLSLEIKGLVQQLPGKRFIRRSVRS